MSRSKAKPKAAKAKVVKLADAKNKPAARRSTVAAEAFKLGDDIAPPPAVDLSSSKASTVVLSLPLDRIDPSPFNPRSTIDEAELHDLAASIAEHGLLQPLVVRLAGAERYELIAGHRRLAALKLNGADRAPCIVRSIGDVATVRALQIIENLQRVDIDPMDEAGAFVSLQAEDPERWSAAAIARAIGKSDRFVAQRLQLARDLAPELQERVKAGTLKIEVARTLAAAPVALQRDVAGHAWAIQDAGTARQQLKSRSVPVEDAAFDLSLYDGAWLEDGDARWFADVAQFERLQQQAAHARVDALRADGWPAAKLVPMSDIWEYQWADTRDQVDPYHDADDAREIGALAPGVDRAAVTALVFVDRRRVRIVKGVIPIGRDVREGEGGEAPGQPVTERQADVDAYNTALADRLAGRPDLSRRLLVYGFISRLGCLGYDENPGPALGPWRDQLASIVDLDDEYGECYQPHTVDPLWALLDGLDDPTIDAMLGRLVAHAMNINRYSRRSDGIERAIAGAVGIGLPGWIEPEPDVDPDPSTSLTAGDGVEIELPAGFPADEPGEQERAA